MKHRILGIVLAIIMVVSVFAVCVSAETFPDVENHWGREPVDYWVGEGDIDGYSDGTFKPDNLITRAEVCQLLANVLNLKADTTKASVFPDVTTDDWFYDAVTACQQLGIVGGYPDGSFGPDRYITRQEAVAMIVRVTSIPENDDTSAFIDGSDTSGWATGFVGGLNYAGILEGYPDGTVRPLRDITRAEMVKLLQRVDLAVKDTANGNRTGVKAVAWAIGDRYATAVIIPTSGGGGRTTNYQYKCRVKLTSNKTDETLEMETTNASSWKSPVLADIFALFNEQEETVFADFIGEVIRTDYHELYDAYVNGGDAWSSLFADVNEEGKVTVSVPALAELFRNNPERNYGDYYARLKNSTNTITYTAHNGYTYTVDLTVTRA